MNDAVLGYDKTNMRQTEWFRSVSGAELRDMPLSGGVISR